MIAIGVSAVFLHLDNQVGAGYMSAPECLPGEEFPQVETKRAG
jgi:hypothetical protein